MNCHQNKLIKVIIEKLSNAELEITRIINLGVSDVVFPFLKGELRAYANAIRIIENIELEESIDENNSHEILKVLKKHSVFLDNQCETLAKILDKLPHRPYRDPPIR